MSKAALCPARSGVLWVSQIGPAPIQMDDPVPVDDPALTERYASPEQQAARELYVERQLKVLAMRAIDLAERVRFGDIQKIDAVDMAYSAAVISGLVSAAGDDVVQQVLANAFSGT